MTVLPVCIVCLQTKEWHRVHHPKHKFVSEGEEPKLEEEQAPTSPSNSMRGDPVLRLALIRAGVIDEAQVAEAEIWVREAAAQGGAVTIENGEYKLLTIEEWIGRMAAGRL
jgi:hypothetical protein